MTAEWPGFGLLHPGLRVAMSDTASCEIVCVQPEGAGVQLRVLCQPPGAGAALLLLICLLSNSPALLTPSKVAHCPKSQLISAPC